MLILTFEDREEEILNHIISYVSTGARAFQVIENAKTNLSFNGLEIDDINRSVRKQKQEIDLTFTEFEILYLLATIQAECSARSRFMILSGKNHIPVITTLS